MTDAAPGSGLSPDDLRRAADYVLVGYDSDPERLRGMVEARAKVIEVLLAEIDRLRADQERLVEAGNALADAMPLLCENLQAKTHPAVLAWLEALASAGVSS